MTRKSTIKLLLVNESDNAGEQLVSLFRNAGRVARATLVSSSEELFTALKDKDNWDLLITDDQHPEITPEQCLEQCKKSKADIPVIVIREKCTHMSELCSAGASDVIDPNDETRICFSSFKAVDNYTIQRANNKLSTQLIEIEERCEQLLNQSQDAIAYVSDGMLIGANALFAQQFGYDTPDDLDCLPIIDMISPDDQDNFKALLKAQPSNKENTHFGFNGCKENGEDFDAEMLLSNAHYDDEDCIQLTIGKNAGNNNSNTNLDIDPATGLYNHDYFLSQLNTHIKQAVAGTSISTVLFIGIDQFPAIRKRMGITASEAILVDAAQFIQKQTEQESCLSHYCDDGFTMLLPDTGAEKALIFAQEMCKKLEHHIIEIAEQSIQCTISIGLTTLDGQQDNPHEVIDGAFSASELVRDEANNNGIGGNAKIHVPVRERKTLGDASSDEELDQVLEEALEDKRFQLMFQPIVSLRGSAGDYYEVIITMLNENDELVGANDFLGSLNFSGINTRLDRWIILEATKLLSGERDKGQDIRLLINLTTHALQDKSLIPWFSVALKAGGIPAEAIIFQFSEHDIADNLTPAIGFSETLQGTGGSISINHFGANDDPIKLLKHVNPTFVRLNSNYTEQLDGSSDTESLKSLVSEVSSNKAKTIIPDIQNASALAVLWQIGADYIQGDYLAAPGNEMNHEFTDIA